MALYNGRRFHRAGVALLRYRSNQLELLCVHGSQHNKWSLPKGHLDYGETCIEAALRELKEETNVVVDITEKYVYFGTYAIYFIEFVNTPIQTKINDCNEIDRIKWMSISDVLKLSRRDANVGLREFVRHGPFDTWHKFRESRNPNETVIYHCRRKQRKNSWRAKNNKGKPSRTYVEKKR